VSGGFVYFPYSGCTIHEPGIGDATDRRRRYGTNKTSNSTVRNNVLSGAFAFGLVSGSEIRRDVMDPANISLLLAPR
jgi:hypothetical protein